MKNLKFYCFKSLSNPYRVLKNFNFMLNFCCKKISNVIYNKNI